MRFNSSIVLVSATLVLLALTACQTTGRVPLKPKTDPETQPVIQSGELKLASELGQLETGEEFASESIVYKVLSAYHSATGFECKRLQKITAVSTGSSLICTSASGWYFVPAIDL